MNIHESLDFYKIWLVKKINTQFQESSYPDAQPTFPLDSSKFFIDNFDVTVWIFWKYSAGYPDF